MTPQLRFPEFIDEWREVKLSDVATKGEYGMNAAAKPFDGINKYLRITDIDDETRQLISDGLTSPSGMLDDKYLLQRGDIVFTRTGASTGKTYLYNEQEGRLYFAGFLIRFHIHKANPYFVCTQTLRRNYQKWIVTVSARSGQPGINAEEYAAYKFFVPKNAEQEKIADFLTTVDERIKLSEQKLEQLQKYKRGVMQKIFSQQIRFKDESGNNYPDWEEKKLGEILEFLRTNSSPRAELSTIGDVMNVHYGDIHTKLGAHFDAAKQKLSYLKFAGNSELVKVGDLIIADASEDRLDVGKSVEVIDTNGLNIVSGLHTLLARPKMLALGFAGYLMQSVRVRRQLWRIATGASVLGISKSELSKLTINLPAIEEQGKIANFLTALDNKITIEKTHLSAAKQYKKGLLQRMFV